MLKFLLVVAARRLPFGIGAIVTQRLFYEEDGPSPSPRPEDSSGKNGSVERDSSTQRNTKLVSWAHFAEWISGEQVSTSKDHAPTRPTAAAVDSVLHAAAWMLSCSREQVLDFPALYLFDYLDALVVTSFTWLGGWLGLGRSASRRVAPGMVGLEKALVFGVDEVCLGKPVEVRRAASSCDEGELPVRRFRVGPAVPTTPTTVASEDDAVDAVPPAEVDEAEVAPHRTLFDAVVLAVPPAAAARLLAELEDEDGPVSGPASFLERFKTQWSDAVLHTDTALMPGDRKQWATLNVMHCGNSGAVSKGLTTQLTVWLNSFFGEEAVLSGEQFNFIGQRK